MKSLVRFGSLAAANTGYIDANSIISIVFASATSIVVTCSPSRTITFTVTSDSNYVIHNYIADILISAAQTSSKPAQSGYALVSILPSITIGATTYTVSFAVA